MKPTIALLRLFPRWVRTTHGEGLRAYLLERPVTPRRLGRLLRWALAARFADLPTRVRGASDRGIADQLTAHRRGLGRAASAVFAGSLVTYLMVDDTPLAHLLAQGGILALDWRLFLLSLLAGATALAALALRFRRPRGPVARTAPAPAASSLPGSAIRIAGLALGVAALSGLVIVAASNGALLPAPLRITPVAGRLIASCLLALGGLSALVNARCARLLVRLRGRGTLPRA